MNNLYYSQLKKGQALVELATLGAILLFCLSIFIRYGLQANYTQSIMMKGFRKAMKAAFYNTYTGSNSGVSLTTIKDKRMIDPTDKYGLAERSPFQSEASVTWADSLNQDTVYSDSAYLPAKAYNINDQTSTLFTDGVTTIPSRSLTFNTSGFKEFTCFCDPANPAASQFVNVHEVNYAVPSALNAVYWVNNPVSCCRVWVEAIEQACESCPGGKKTITVARYWNAANQWSTLSQADLDLDGFSETVVEVTGIHGQPVQSFLAIDAQEGELDTSAVEKTHNIGEYLNKQEGLLPGLHQTIQQTGSLVKEETPTQIITTTHVSTEGSVIGRQFRTNKDLVTGNKVITTYSTGGNPLYDKTYTETTPK